MYWIRDIDLIGLAAFGLLSLTWLAGGWLLASHAFALRRGERVLAGFSLGLVLFITLANLLAGPLPLPLAYWLAGVGVLGLGLVSGRSSPRPGLNLRELADPQLLAALALTVLLALIQRGLGVFDDYLHLPLVSTMAAGDIPPHFYLNPTRPFAYHYGLQVLAAGLVRLAGFQPWSAWDLSKALAIALTACLSWMWFARLTRKGWAVLLGSLALIVGGGARWLLLILPQSWLAAVSTRIDLHNTGLDAAPDLLAALHSPWPVDGGGPVAFPFAAHNGVFLPLISVLGSTGALPYLTVLLLGLLAVRRRLRWIEAVVFTLVLANLALSAEHWFALLWISLAVVVAGAWVSRRKSPAASQPPVLPWIGVLGFSAVLSLVQGGFITEAARSTLQGLVGMEGAASSNFYGFALRWPPAIYSAHLGLLSLFNPSHLVVLLAELGPGLLLAGAATVFTMRALRRGAWMVGALGISALLNMLFPIFVVYGVDRSVTRFPATALWLWLMLGLPVVWWAARRAVRQLRRDAPPSSVLRSRLPMRAAALLVCLALGYAVLVGGGLVVFGVQAASIPEPQLTYYLDYLDASMSQALWNKLEPDAQVLDSIPFRAVTLFGRASTAHDSIYVPLPQWEALIANPDPHQVAQAGYSYIYMDEGWWNGLAPAQRQALEQPCMDIVEEKEVEEAGVRLLIDVSGCKP